MRAITQGWDVPLDKRPEVINALLDIALSSDDDSRRIGAAKVLLSATKLQLDEARLKLDEKIADEVYEVNVYGHDRSDPERPDATPDKGIPGVEASPPGSPD
jgi:hypothetical protein